MIPTSICFSFKNNIFPKYYDSSEIFVILRRLLFLFLSQICSHPIQFIPAEFKYRRDSNGLNIHFHTPTMTDARIHFTSYVFMYLCLHMDPPQCCSECHSGTDKKIGGRQLQRWAGQFSSMRISCNFSSVFCSRQILLFTT